MKNLNGTLFSSKSQSKAELDFLPSDNVQITSEEKDLNKGTSVPNSIVNKVSLRRNSVLLRLREETEPVTQRF